MFAFLNSAMVAASQRFISYELGRGNKERLNLVFCTSINIHVIIAVIIFYWLKLSDYGLSILSW